MKIKNILLNLVVWHLVLISNLSGQGTNSSEFNVFQIGFSPNNNFSLIIRDNIDFELDNLVYQPTNSFSKNSPNIHLGFQKYGRK